MENKNLSPEQKLHVILCGPLAQTEHALLQRGDVEIKREDDNLNLLAQMGNSLYDCDMVIVEAPYGHGLYSMTYPVRAKKNCPAWMVADPPDNYVWKEINRQLDNIREKKKATHEAAVRTGPPGNEVLLLADDPQRRSSLTAWTQDIFAGWAMTPEITAPEDVKTYLREMYYQHAQDKPPMMVIVALSNVAGLNTVEQIRNFYPRCGLIWSCDLDFALQSFNYHTDDFFLLKDASRERLEQGLTKWKASMEKRKDRGSKS